MHVTVMVGESNSQLKIKRERKRGEKEWKKKPYQRMDWFNRVLFEKEIKKKSRVDEFSLYDMVYRTGPKTRQTTWVSRKACRVRVSPSYPLCRPFIEGEETFSKSG